MADESYKRLNCGACESLFAIPSRRGRPPKTCPPCMEQKRSAPKHGYGPAGGPCQAKDCEAKAKSRGLCVRHYQRQRKHGTLNAWVQRCEHCNKEFASDRKKKYCARSCAEAAQYAKLGHRPHAEYAASVRNPAHWFVCEYCKKESHRNLGGASVRNGYRNRWCSQRCRSQSALDLKAASGPLFCAYFAGQCVDCSLPFGSRKETERCGRCTGMEMRRVASEASRLWSEAKHRAKAVVVECAECSAKFCPLYGAKHGSIPLCSPCASVRKRAARKAAKKMRAALQRGANGGQAVRKDKVFERDGWRCRLCGVETPRLLVGSCEINAPELDHIVPVSRGGAHTYANTQCLCRSCNGWKGARTMDEVRAALAA